MYLFLNLFMVLHFSQVFIYKFILENACEYWVSDKFQDNENCHLLMKAGKKKKRLSEGFQGYSILFPLRLIQILMHSLSSFKCGNGLDKVISDCFIWVQDFCIQCSGTICGNHLWINAPPQHKPVLCILFDLLRWFWFFSWQSHKNSRGLWRSWRDRQPGPCWQWGFVGSRWCAAFLIWPCVILWAWSTVPPTSQHRPPASWPHT